MRAEAPRTAFTAQPGAQPPRHPIYWIDECPPHNRTREIAARSARNLPAFLEHKGVAPYNADAFAEARGAYAAYCARQGRQVGDVPLLLDSCCGTGRSTWNLAALRPDAFVIGVDKSLVRLTRNAAFRHHASAHGPDADGDADPDSAEDSLTLAREDEDTGDSSDDDLDETPKGGQGRSGRPRPQRDNMILVRANCIDFWRLVWESGLPIESHTILYPNPYPKQKQVVLRWHGSPSFPILLYMGAPIEVRASWRTYLEEMALAVDEICSTGPLEIEELIVGQNMDRPLSNFETKYVKAQQPIYRLRIPALPRVPPPPAPA
eukprot:Tamp_12868.p1 GENE.Tamp_12868~~Tamp_12868.p1  ORF type:complete len:327 (+),score=43.89 Tamp_12868:22-981(+)